MIVGRSYLAPIAFPVSAMLDEEKIRMGTMTHSQLVSLQDGKTSKMKDIPAYKMERHSYSITNQHIRAEDTQRQPAAALTACSLKGALGPDWAGMSFLPSLCNPPCAIWHIICVLKVFFWLWVVSQDGIAGKPPSKLCNESASHTGQSCTTKVQDTVA